jgi:hypothetical protein
MLMWTWLVLGGGEASGVVDICQPDTTQRLPQLYWEPHARLDSHPPLRPVLRRNSWTMAKMEIVIHVLVGGWIALLNPCLATGRPMGRATGRLTERTSPGQTYRPTANNAMAVVGGDGMTDAAGAEGGCVGDGRTGSSPPIIGGQAGVVAADGAPATVPEDATSGGRGMEPPLQAKKKREPLPRRCCCRCPLSDAL